MYLLDLLVGKELGIQNIGGFDIPFVLVLCQLRVRCTV